MKYTPFLGLDLDVACDEQAPYAVLPIPYEWTVSYGKGTQHGPAAILEASTQVELFDEELAVRPPWRVRTLPALNFSEISEKDAMDSIRRAAEEYMSEDCFVLSLGGEHSITAPLVAAAKSTYGPIDVLQIDAHADLREEYEGSPHSHAAVMSRVRELGVKTVGVGVRSLSRKEHQLIEKEQLPVFWAEDIADLEDDVWTEQVLHHVGDRVYLTIDIDGLDPSLVPGTGTPEPGGLDWYDVIHLVRRIFMTRKVVAADIVEVAPIAGSHVSEFVAARLAAKLLLYHQVLSAGQ